LFVVLFIGAKLPNTGAHCNTKHLVLKYPESGIFMSLYYVELCIVNIK
jgi:hypothetical protein